MPPKREVSRNLILALLVMCTSASAEVHVREDIITDPSPRLFTVCHGNGCINLDYLSLTPDQWLSLQNAFLPMTHSAGEERERLRHAIQLMEIIVGHSTGTWRDKGGTFNGGDGQLDCIDESTNTSLYLVMFEKYGLMRMHTVEDRSTRGWFIGGWPHTTAVIAEITPSVSMERKLLWAVDSWFLDNGELPFILPLEEWEAGWMPTQ